MGDKWPHEPESSDLRPGNLTLETGLPCNTQAQGQQTETAACIYAHCGSRASQELEASWHTPHDRRVSFKGGKWGGGALEQGRGEREALITLMRIT